MTTLSHYSFDGYMGFSQYIKASREDWDKLREENKNGEEFKDIKVEEGIQSMVNFLKDVDNSIGGCGCNRAKRQEIASNSYVNAVEKISESTVVTQEAKSLLNGVMKIHFFHHPGGTIQTNPPFKTL